MKRIIVNMVLATAFAVASLVWCAPQAAASPVDAVELADMSLEELMGIEVYSVAKKKQKLSESAAAAYVLTHEDIRRSGATSIPEALRLVPGVEVAQLDSNKWAITIRGFNDRFANKLLVLIDGRSVYTPLFAGVYWDAQDTLLEDIDRIEVIRGPGGTLWGANAVNGVINIITKSSADTQGVLASASVGSELAASGAMRYGGRIGDQATYRLYAKYFDRDDFETAAGDDATDEWRQKRAGFRADWDADEDDSFFVQGEIYEGDSNSLAMAATLDPPYAESFGETTEVGGGHVLARWSHRFGENSETETQVYYDRTERESRDFREERDTVDIEFQHHIGVGEYHDIVWGLGYRITGDDIDPDFRFQWTPRSHDSQLVSGFVQDEISLLDDAVRLTLGSKIEYNEFSGFEVQPNARVLWKPAERQAVWAAVSRAVRTPSRSEDDIRINSQVIPPGGIAPGIPPVPTIVALLGDSGFDSEELLAFEVGYRTQPTDTLSFDVAAYHNDYENLRTITPDPAFPFGFIEDTHGVMPFLATNFMDATAYGVEVAADWWPVDAWRLRAGYTFLDLDLDLEAGGAADPLSLGQEGASPRNQFFLRSLADLPADLELDTTFRWVDRLESSGVDAYETVDVRLGWRPTESLELSVVGQNLIDSQHPEFASSSLVATEVTRVERSVYGKIVWTY